MENNYYKVINITLLVSQDISEAKIKECLERDFLIESEGKTNTGITQWQIVELPKLVHVPGTELEGINKPIPC